MQHGYAQYLGNIQTHALAAVDVSHHGSFIFHGAKCYYNPEGRSRMVRCDWLAFGKHQCRIHFRFHENICYILVTKPHTHTLHRDARWGCKMPDLHKAPRTVIVLLVEWAVLRAFAIRPWDASLWVNSCSYLPWFTVSLQYQNSHPPKVIFNIKCPLSSQQCKILLERQAFGLLIKWCSETPHTWEVISSFVRKPPSYTSVSACGGWLMPEKILFFSAKLNPNLGGKFRNTKQ